LSIGLFGNLLSPTQDERTIMTLVLSEAVDADFDRLMEIQFAAFGQSGDSHREPFVDIIWPGGDTAVGQAAARDRTLQALREEPTATFLKITDTTTGEIIGGAKWQVYMKKPENKPVEAVWWEGDDREFAEFALGILYRGRLEKTAPEGPYLCELLFLVQTFSEFLNIALRINANVESVLDIIFVDPKHQSRGAGSKLVKWGVNRADEMGVEAFLEATRFGRPLYEKNGFQVIEHVVIQVPEKWAHKPKLQHFWMQRPAAKKAV
jgi:GNAT superfamily N-acetyltransferase